MLVNKMNSAAVPDHHPRYVVREITGFALTVGSKSQATTVWIADTWNCWREVVWYPTPTREEGGVPTATQRRASAAERCAELNAEHDAWLACA